MKVYDCFTFYNEFELLELRLKSLWDMVDYFVLVESDKTHNNVPKPFHFAEHEKDFKEFLPKIRNIQLNVDIEYKGVGDWAIENGQRDGILHGLSDAEPDDLIFISDVDEIPEPDILNRISKNKVQLISQCPITPPPCRQDLSCTLLITCSGGGFIGIFADCHESIFSLVLSGLVEHKRFLARHDINQAKKFNLSARFT